MFSEGDKVVMYYVVVNCDFDKFENLNMFDIECVNVNEYLVFGNGLYVCFGKCVVIM